MLSEGGGRIVNIASIIGFTGYRGLSVYGATKASMLGFTRSLAREVGRYGVNVNAVAPGFIETDMTQTLQPEQRGRVARRSALQQLPDAARFSACRRLRTWPMRSSFCSETRRGTSPGQY
jgi:3-oxoacyl-[acyl-carrier protein] reductase